MDNLSIAHTRWNCTYHIVFIPKYRRKIMYGELKRELAEILKKLCEMKQVRLIEGNGYGSLDDLITGNSKCEFVIFRQLAYEVDGEAGYAPPVHLVS